MHTTVPHTAVFRLNVILLKVLAVLFQYSEYEYDCTRTLTVLILRVVSRNSYLVAVDDALVGYGGT